MSRRDGRYVQVETDAKGMPTSLTFPGASAGQHTLRCMGYWREWIGILEGEPERDVWRVETEQGICELHCLRYPPPDEYKMCVGEEEDTSSRKEQWLLYRWED